MAPRFPLATPPMMAPIAAPEAPPDIAPDRAALAIQAAVPPVATVTIPNTVMTPIPIASFALLDNFAQFAHLYVQTEDLSLTTYQNVSTISPI